MAPSKVFKLEAPKGNNSKIAPGLDVVYEVVFSPEEKIDYTCDICVASEVDTFTVPVMSVGSRGMTSEQY